MSRLLSIRRLTTSPYHPACNGLVEKFNGTLKQMLPRLCYEQLRQWNRFISPLLFAYRVAQQDATGFSPFEQLYGRTVKGPVQILKELWSEEENVPGVTISYQYVLELRERLSKKMKLAQLEVKRYQTRNTKLYNRIAKKRVFIQSDCEEKSISNGKQSLEILPTDHNKLPIPDVILSYNWINCGTCCFLFVSSQCVITFCNPVFCLLHRLVGFACSMYFFVTKLCETLNFLQLGGMSK